MKLQRTCVEEATYFRSRREEEFTGIGRRQGGLSEEVLFSLGFAGSIGVFQVTGWKKAS